MPRAVLRGGDGALRRLEHPGAVLVAALVLAHAAGGVLVGVAQRRADLLDVLVVVAGPRLVVGQRLDALEDRRAGVVRALVRRHGGELLLREAAEALDDLGRVEVVVAGDRGVGRRGARRARRRARAGARPRAGARARAAGRRARAAGCRARGARRRARAAGRRAGAPAGGPRRPARRLRRRAGRLTDGVGGPGRRGVERGTSLDVRAGDRVGQLRDLLVQQPVEHALLVREDVLRELRGLAVAVRGGEPLDRGVRRDLERLGRAVVLGVLEDLLLAARPAHHVEGRLAEGERLADDGLGQADPGQQRVAAGLGVKRVGALAHTVGVAAGLLEMLLDGGAGAAPGRHRDLALQDADQRALRRVRLLEVLHDLLLVAAHGFGLLRVRSGRASVPAEGGGRNGHERRPAPR